MNTMNAFFSGTDNGDDRNSISFSGVVGKMNQATPETVWRFNYQDRKFEAKFEDMFDVQADVVPEEWLNKVETQTFGYRSNFTGSLGWNNNHHGNNSNQVGFPTSGNNGGKSLGKGKADHLKPYQFKKKEEIEDNNVNGNRIGPQLRNDTYRRNGQHWSEDGLDSLWGFGGIDVSDSDLMGDALGGSARLGKPQGGQGINQESELQNEALSDPFPPGFDENDGEDTIFSFHPRFDEIAINHGNKVANAFCMIDDAMTELTNEDGLIEDLIKDMFELSSEESKLDIFRGLYDRLSSRDREALASRGL